MICNNKDNLMQYNEEDISRNSHEIITIFNSMIQPNASTKFNLYNLYKEPFENFAYESLQINRVLNHHVELTLPEYKEEDRKILVKPKPKSVVELFNVQKI